MIADEKAYFLVLLKFGEPIEGDPFNQNRVHKDNVDEAHQSKFLHPVVFFCEKGEIKSEHHMIEDLEADWSDRSVHFEPLAKFIKNHL